MKAVGWVGMTLAPSARHGSPNEDQAIALILAAPGNLSSLATRIFNNNDLFFSYSDSVLDGPARSRTLACTYIHCTRIGRYLPGRSSLCGAARAGKKRSPPLWRMTHRQEKSDPFIIAEMPASQGNLLVARPPLNHFLDAFASQVGRPIKQHDRLIFL